MKFLFCEHPRRPLSKEGYCSYYGEIFYALKKQCDITFTSKRPSKVSELGQNWDAIILGHAHTDAGHGKPHPLIQDTNIPLFPILNKEYAGLEGKLNWVKSMNATACLTVQHEIEKYTNVTKIPFHRFMWSCDENVFKDYGDGYTSDLFYSGVVRSNQHKNLRCKILKNLSKLGGYNLSIYARHEKNNYEGKVLSPMEYARKLCGARITLTTPSPANLVNPRYFECMASNKSLVLCSRVEDELVYADMVKEDENCVMFSSENEFFEKAIYYLDNESERIKIVNQAYNHFINSQTWEHRATELLNIIKKYINKP
jgi:hypothetical protein